MQVVFLLLSAALLLLAVLLLWFVPHLLNQQEQRATQEAHRLRSMLADVLGEQEAVARRQTQFGTSLSYLQDQLEHLHDDWPQTVAQLTVQPNELGQVIMGQLDQRLGSLQQQLEYWMSDRQSRLSNLTAQENESWAYLMSLLGTMQDQLSAVPHSRSTAASAPAELGGPSLVAHDLRDEVESLRLISEEIAALQWRLRRSVINPAPAKKNGSPLASEIHSLS